MKKVIAILLNAGPLVLSLPPLPMRGSPRKQNL